MKQKIGILCPSDSEAAPFLADMEGVTETRKAMLRFYEGTFHGVDVVTLFSGVCKVNAALATQILIDSYQAGAVLNVGTAGALAPGLSIFDTVIATEAGYHDVSPEILTEFHPWLPAPVFPSDARLLALARQAAAGGSTLWCLDGWSQGRPSWRTRADGRRSGPPGTRFPWIWRRPPLPMSATSIRSLFWRFGPLQTPPISGARRALSRTVTKPPGLPRR